jgi:type IV pilus assembly protein PilA
MIKMKKLNNKGFSLVELIIVIAIMAILVGVVGTQVIPYLENSRKAKDQQVLSAWNTAAVSAYSTEAGSLDSTAEYKITCNVNASKQGTFSYSSTPSSASGLSNLQKTFEALTAISGSYDFGQMASKAGKAITKVEITINGVDGQVVTVTTCSGDYSFDAIENK